jgi:hypothetical protein
LSHLFGDADALAVEPVLASVARDHELVAVRLLADAPQPFRVIFGVLKSSKNVGFFHSSKINLNITVTQRAQSWFRGASVVEGKLFEQTYIIASYAF